MKPKGRILPINTPKSQKSQHQTAPSSAAEAQGLAGLRAAAQRMGVLTAQEQVAHAIDGFTGHANAASSVLLLCVADIEWSSKYFSDWEQFEWHPEFIAGLHGMAKTAILNLAIQEQHCRSHLEKNDPKELGKCIIPLDDAVCAVKGLLQLTTQTSHHSESDTYFAAKLAWERLEGALDEVRGSTIDLERAAGVWAGEPNGRPADQAAA